MIQIIIIRNGCFKFFSIIIVNIPFSSKNYVNDAYKNYFSQFVNEQPGQKYILTSQKLSCTKGLSILFKKFHSKPIYKSRHKLLHLVCNSIDIVAATSNSVIWN